MPEVQLYTDSITRALRICLGKKVNFAAYRLPGDTGIDLVVQKNTEVQPLENLTYRLPARGFLIAPFSRKSEKPCLIRPDMFIHHSVTQEQVELLDALPENHVKRTSHVYPEDTLREDYIRLIDNTIGRIHTGEFDKVVLSRVKTIYGRYYNRLYEIFDILCSSYPNAFVYLFCVNGQCWTGASPEPFICSRGNELVTVSLAGTRPYCSADLEIGNWNSKELEEQNYVTRHIEKILNNYSVTAYSKNGPYVARAGNLLHLRTDFSFSALAVGDRLPSLIDALHPTPAVCGMSTGKAMDFIGTAEKHTRGYYTGFLGQVGLGELIQLYVNLRCMRVFDDRLVLFVGGGITHDSVPEAEWEETEIKSETLLSVVQQLI